jgi:diadenosine tetraphosphate (Ap4A) HIT family hydrolase
MDDCLFCEIIAGNSPAGINYQDDLVIVFLDINPVNPGHTLVVPRVHRTYLNDLDEEPGMHILPRLYGDSFKISADWSSHPARNELDQIAERIRKGFAP